MADYESAGALRDLWRQLSLHDFYDVSSTPSGYTARCACGTIALSPGEVAVHANDVFRMRRHWAVPQCSASTTKGTQCRRESTTYHRPTGRRYCDQHLPGGD
jgi:hypothetical protein